MQGSNKHKQEDISREEKESYLQEAAPKWHKKHGMNTQLTVENVLEYAQERYKWVEKTLRETSKLATTIWNMGNHESPEHFLVLQELPFLLEQPMNFSVPDEQLQTIFYKHEQALAVLELTNNFVYIRDKPYIQEDTLIIGIPGESHAAIGSSKPARKQEEQTLAVLKKASKKLPEVTNAIIYNHTQGSYDKNTSTFMPASTAAKEFMNQTSNLQHLIWVQSHNHWSYTQHLHKENTHYVLNNAGLHNAIYNLLELDEELTIYDVDANKNTITKLQQSNQEITGGDALAIIKRNYPNYMDVYLHRKMRLDATKQPRTS